MLGVADCLKVNGMSPFKERDLRISILSGRKIEFLKGEYSTLREKLFSISYICDLEVAVRV